MRQASGAAIRRATPVVKTPRRHIIRISSLTHRKLDLDLDHNHDRVVVRGPYHTITRLEQRNPPICARSFHSLRNWPALISRLRTTPAAVREQHTTATMASTTSSTTTEWPAVKVRDTFLKFFEDKQHTFGEAILHPCYALG
jgi:hypothetical protein